MRNFHLKKNQFFCPTINIERLWSLVSDQARKYYSSNTNKSGKLPVIDCVQAGFFKVLGRGRLPAIPLIVRAKFFSKVAERRIKAIGGFCELVA